MSDLISQVKEQQGTVQRLQKEQHMKAGRKEQLLKQLKDDFEVSDADEARALLEEYENVRKRNEETLRQVKAELDEIVASARPNSSGTTD